MCLDASRRALQNAAPAASSPTHCSLGCCRSAARLLSAKKMSWELARFPHCRLEGGVVSGHTFCNATAGRVAHVPPSISHFPFPIAITSTSEPVASCWMLTELAWCFGWVCERLRGMAWGKMGWVLGFWPLPDRVIGPTSAQRVGGLGSLARSKTLNELANVQHARARDGRGGC